MREVILVRRPEGPVRADCFAVREQPAPSVREGTLLLRNRWCAVEPAIRQWIAGRARYMQVQPGEAVRSVCLGEVIESRLEGFAPGDLVRALGGWQDFSVVGKRDFLYRIPPELTVSATTHLGVLGSAGLAAWFGLFDIAQPQSGETVVVSSAAGAVGSVAIQLARDTGAQVVAICGGEEKAAWLREVCGIATVIDYRQGGLAAALRETCPKGIDVYFDNTGGETLEAALQLLAVRGRIVLCGATSQYDRDLPPAPPRNYLALLETGGRMQGLMTAHYATRFPEAVEGLARRLLEGRLHYREQILFGLEQAPAALERLFNCQHFGRILVQVAP